MNGKTLFDKIWGSHLIAEREGGEGLLYVDRNLLHEGPFYAFDALAKESRKVHRPLQTLAFSDHYVPTTARALGSAAIRDGEARVMVEQLARNSRATGIVHFGLEDDEQGVMHVAGPELGLCEPGMLMAGADSHTSTNGAFGLFGFGVGASQVKHILATQTVWFARPRTMRITIDGTLSPLVSGKDLILAIIAAIGIDGGIGHIIEYAGSAIRGLSMEGRMTVCNMSIEGGAKAGLIAPDQTTFDYIKGRPYAPAGDEWDAALADWKTLRTDDGAVFDHEEIFDGAEIEPHISWGTNPGQVIPLSGRVPSPDSFVDPTLRNAAERALEYMDLTAGTPMRDVGVDVIFIGSCTNGRIEDLRAVAEVVQGHQVASGLRTFVVPGSHRVKDQAEAEGLDVIFRDAGFDWREPGCSMCLGMNPDTLAPGERSASTSNRNFEGRQGRGGRTHLVSPAVAAATAIAGHFASPEDL
ncbi:MAG TPA: 3-isopropylmalate dehydratase large subunit [Burkholderiales bacterium]